MTRVPIRPLPILALAAVLPACSPPAGYSNPDIRADYTIGNHLFDVRAVRAGEGYDVYVAELGGPYLTDFVTLETDIHLEAAKQVIGARCAQATADNHWRTFGLEPAPQPVLGIVARFTCA